MTLATQGDVYFGGAMDLSAAVPPYRVHPVVARCYVVAPSAQIETIQLPVDDFKKLGLMFWIWNVGFFPAEVVDPTGPTVVGTISANQGGIVFKLSHDPLKWVVRERPIGI